MAWRGRSLPCVKRCSRAAAYHAAAGHDGRLERPCFTVGTVAAPVVNDRVSVRCEYTTGWSLSRCVCGRTLSVMKSVNRVAVVDAC